MKALALVVVCALAGCTPTTQKPACSQATLDAAQAAYLLEVEKIAITGICRKYEHAADCPELADALAKRNAASKAWENCR